MSNAMRSGKRLLAGVAAGALGAGMLTFVGAVAAPAANAFPTLSDTAATVAPVRFSTYAGGTANSGASRVPVLGSPVEFEALPTVAADDTVIITLLAAPAGNALVAINQDSTNVIDDTGTAAATADDTIILGQPSDVASARSTVIGGGNAADIMGRNGSFADDSVVHTFFSVGRSGTYEGKFDIWDGNVIRQTVTFSFTTSGAPTSITLAPTTASIAANNSDTEAFNVSVKDSTGKLTQLSSNGTSGPVSEYILMQKSSTPATATEGDFNLPTSFLGNSAAGGALTASVFDDTDVTTLGTATWAVGGVSTATPGTRNLNMVPLGLLPSYGMAATALPVTVVGAGSNSPSSITMTAPTSQYFDDTNTDDTKGYSVNSIQVATATLTTTGSTPSAPFAMSITRSGLSGLKANGVSLATGANTIVVNADATGKGTVVFTWTAAQTGQISALTGSTNTAGPNKYKWGVIDVFAATNDSSTIPGTAVVIKTGENQSYAASLVDTFGNALSGYTITATTTSNASPLVTATGAVATTNARGEAIVVAPPPSATFTGAATTTFTVKSSTGTTVTAGQIGSLASVAATYSATGAVTGLSVAVAGGSTSPLTNVAAAQSVLPWVLVPSDGTANTAASGTYTTATGAGAAGGEVVAITATPTPGNTVVVTAPEGVKVSRSASTAWNGGAQTLDFASGATAYVFATKTGTHDVTVKSGDLSVVVKIRVANAPTDAYNISLSPSALTVPTSGFSTFELTVTDVFGNPVPNTTSTNGIVTLTATGKVVLGGYMATAQYTTGANGKATITAIGDREAGVGEIVATPGVLSNAWATGFTPPTAAPAPVKESKVVVTVTSGSTKSITITGSRTTVSGKPGIEIDGVVTGIENGKTVVPYFRFPGQTTFTQGTARPKIENESFIWQRKTGKKFYAYVTSDDGAVTSNRVVIPAN